MPVAPQFRTGKTVIEDFKLEYRLAGADGDIQTVPPGHAVSVVNMLSVPGQTRSRWGLTAVANFSSDVRSMKEFVAQDAETRRLLTLDAGATLSQTTDSAYSWTNIQLGLVEASVASTIRMNSATMFGREHIALATNGVTAAQVPLAWDGTDLRRVAPGGPGVFPGCGDGAAGNISAGVHGIRVMFRTKWGFLTPPSPAGTWTAAGAKVANVAAIPTGPSYVVGRVLCFTAADDTDYYFIAGSAMDIEDNTTTTATVDFTDTELLAGTPVSVAGSPDNDMLSLINLPAQSACWRYKERMVWVGERSDLVRNGDIGPLAMGFDGGFTAGLPNGWISKSVGWSDATAVTTGEFGGSLAISSTGAASHGCLENLSTDLSWIPPGVDIRWRARVQKNAFLAAGSLNLVLVTATGAAATATVEPITTGTGSTSTSISAAEASTSEWRIIDRLFLSAANNTKASRTYRFRLVGGGTGIGTAMTNLGAWFIDYIELYVASAPTQPSLARISRASQPDAYDGLSGFQYIAQDNGQRIVTGFELGDVCYYVKERSLHSTRDDGSGEPAFWPTNLISNRVGTPSAQGVGIGDQWVVIAGKDGLYYFDGGEPVPLHQPAESRWTSNNWANGHKLVCRVDMDRKAILVSFGIQIMHFQWTGQSPLGQVLRFNTLFCQPGGAGTEVLAMTRSQRSDGTEHFLIAVASGHTIARIDDSTHSDFGNFIGYNYVSGLFGDLEGAKTFDKLRFYMRGQGTVLILLRGLDGTLDTTLTHVLSAAPKNDIEMPEIRVNRTRCWIDIQPSGTTNGDYLVMTRLVIYWHEDFERGTITRGT